MPKNQEKIKKSTKRKALSEDTDRGKESKGQRTKVAK